MSTVFQINQFNSTYWRNAKGTWRDTNAIGTWKDYWLEHSDMKFPLMCSVIGCANRAVYGAHVTQSEDVFDKDAMYIAPLCRYCNNPMSMLYFNLAVGTRLVSVK
ncbi:hypothetical protein [Vibrio astriarenae]|uniref:hypothetical protein n=1 Tax=Vibrio astriarenae TaxID=1481923 RepID=UPI003736917B